MWLLKCTWNFRNFKLEFLFNSKRPSLGPVYAVGEKGKKTGWNDIDERSEASGCLGMGKGRRSLETCRFLVSCSDWPNVFMSTDSRCCWQYRALSMSRSYYSETIQISLLDFANPSAPRRETNIYLWSVRKRKTRPSKCGFFFNSPVRNNGHIFTKRLTYI